MKLAAVRAIAALAHAEIPEVVAQAYGAAGLRFGRDYLIPKPFDPRLIEVVAPAVAQAAADSGVALRPIADIEAYRQRTRAASSTSRATRCSRCSPPPSAARRSVIYAEGEDERVLRAAQVVVDEGLARPLLLGRPDVMRKAHRRVRPAAQAGRELRLDRPAGPGGLRAKRPTIYHALRKRDGVSRALARAEMRSRSTLLAATMLRMGEADAMLCGTVGRTGDHLQARARRRRPARRRVARWR